MTNLDAGKPREIRRLCRVGIRPWLVDPAVVDRIVAERCPRRQQAAE